MENREGAVDVAAGNVSARAGFRVITHELLAGGPVELEFFLENRKSAPFRITVRGDRARSRPGQFAFTALFEGAPIVDPAAQTPNLGGPAGIVEVSADAPWRQPLLLNEFLRLEDTSERLDPGAAGVLDLTCRRPLDLADGPEAGLEAPDLTIRLALPLRRDDAALSALVSALYQEILEGQSPGREHSLGLLLSLRSRACEPIVALAHHANASIAERAQMALQLMH